MICVGFDGTDASVIDPLLDRGVSSVILFARNYTSPEQVWEMCADIKNRAGRPVLICVDQEGGNVTRLTEPFTRVPAMRVVGRGGDEEIAREIGRVLGRELRAVNIDMDLAPILDIDTNPANPVIGERSFGATAEIVSRMGVAMIDGLQAEGVAACGKHFPGHGDTHVDSHLDLPRLPHPMDRLEQMELKPFAAAIRAGVAAIMTAHVIFEPLDRAKPATMSAAVLEGILREKLKFDGVIVSDCLEMKAIADHYGVDEAVANGAAAGVNMFLVSHTAELQHRAIDALVRAAENGVVSSDRLIDSNRRLNKLFAEYVREPAKGNLSQIGSREHLEVVERLT